MYIIVTGMVQQYVYVGCYCFTSIGKTNFSLIHFTSTTMIVLLFFVFHIMYHIHTEHIQTHRIHMSFSFLQNIIVLVLLWYKYKRRHSIQLYIKTTKPIIHRIVKIMFFLLWDLIFKNLGFSWSLGSDGLKFSTRINYLNKICTRKL